MAENKKTEKAVLAFFHAAEKYYGDWRMLISRSFVAGLFTAIGATAGLALVVWVFGFILESLGVLPVVGDFFSRLNELLHDLTGR